MEQIFPNVIFETSFDISNILKDVSRHYTVGLPELENRKVNGLIVTKIERIQKNLEPIKGWFEIIDTLKMNNIEFADLASQQNLCVTLFLKDPKFPEKYFYISISLVSTIFTVYELSEFLYQALDSTQKKYRIISSLQLSDLERHFKIELKHLFQHITAINFNTLMNRKIEAIVPFFEDFIPGSNSYTLFEILFDQAYPNAIIF
jgi:hypothetical protein